MHASSEKSMKTTRNRGIQEKDVRTLYFVFETINCRLIDLQDSQE